MQADFVAGQAVGQYLLALCPHEALRKEIKTIKENFKNHYACAQAMYGSGHIALAVFTQYEIFEKRIMAQLRMMAKTITPFTTELKNFGSFPSHTIYINITSKVPIMNAVKKLRAPQRLMKIDEEHKPHFITAPYITIANKLLPWQYEKGWLEYEHVHFHGRFIADKILLLKKNPGDIYRPLETFSFLDVCASTKQTGLFT